MSDVTTVYRTYADGRLLYTGPDLSVAISEWNRNTYRKRAVGGVVVGEYVEEGYGLLQVRDEWILHVRENGDVFLGSQLDEDEKERFRG